MTTEELSRQMARKDEFIQILGQKLNEYRFRHSLNVADAAVRLAEQNGANTDKAYLCGLLHDIEKNAPFEEQQHYMMQLGEPLPEPVLVNKKLWHAPAGACYVRDELGILDADMIHAIKYHTTGKENMSVLEKIIYVADFISAERDYPDVETIRETAYRSLDEAILAGSRFTLISLLERNRTINHDTIAMYNQMAAELEGKLSEAHDKS